MPMTGFDPVSLGLGVVGNVIGGIFGSSAAKKAAKLQAEAAQTGAERVDRTNAEVNPLITASAGEAGRNAIEAGQAAGARVSSDSDRANLLLNPYRESGDVATGELGKGIAAGGDFNRTPTMADIQIDPGYAFRLQQGQQALERSAAARGSATGGGAIKAVTSFAQGAASQEYQNAFNRFRQSTQDRFSNLTSVANRGQDAAGTEGSNLIGAGKYAGDKLYDSTTYAGDRTYDASKTTANNSIEATNNVNNLLQQKAQAQAGGVIGATNAWTGAISGGINGVTSGLQLKNLLKNPAISGNDAYSSIRAAGGLLSLGKR